MDDRTFVRHYQQVEREADMFHLPLDGGMLFGVRMTLLQVRMMESFLSTSQGSELFSGRVRPPLF